MEIDALVAFIEAVQEEEALLYLDEGEDLAEKLKESFISWSYHDSHHQLLRTWAMRLGTQFSHLKNVEILARRVAQPLQF